jgi:hypothetical protein
MVGYRTTDQERVGDHALRSELKARASSQRTKTSFTAWVLAIDAVDLTPVQ